MKYILRILLVGMIILTASCVPKKKLSYFNDFNELDKPAVNPRIQKPIMPFDKLYIRTLSIEPQINEIFNSSSNEMRFSGASSGIIGYLVDEEGNINFPFVGDINVGSLTTGQAAERIQESLSEYVGKTTITVKYIDNRVTVMGEVTSSGVFTFTQDKITVYEALGMGGGLTRYGDRKNIILLRNENDKIMQYKLNLSDSRITGQEQYYILPNDILIVEPLNAISSSYANITFTTILSSITTLIAILLFTGVNF
ncbi:MAG: polysaccharide biosynthesis/export family protein [Bacteroidales bacterium]|nr:polysaccharide biosynthesis/export family protein [Bacteroidales bacterium]